MSHLSPLSSLSTALAATIATAAPSLVSVHSHRSRATGFVWKPGLIITADEALADDGDIIVAFADGTTRAASIAGRDHTTDIALLRFDGTDVAPMPLMAEVPPLGALAVIAAADQGTPVAALAMVSKSAGPWRSLRGGDIAARIELDTRLRPSSEGGLVLDATGHAIGMAVRGPRRTLVIPTATIERVAGRLETHGRIARGYLGAGLQPVRLDDGLGAMVMSIDKSGPAAAAGLRQGDIITALNKEPFRGMRGLMRELGPYSVGAVVELAALRAGEPVQVALTIGERPA
ncbi:MULTISPECIES: S1C family serine protease [Bradyrhizobium]|uniref:S1C family serine protease n=2 Tax=Nitrobacteraceae TaxID=41294 RepID=UPI00039D1B87|nr:S1C family serine protease [Bradyrhizobium denitrificans]MCL8484227.1 S1C family serine protease [Bradyrhizobium denitrificans]RTL96784.1 MAG: serine protease [Bradyrhizobiaceae bacterium]